MIKIKGSIHRIRYDEKRKQGIHALRHTLERERRAFPNHKWISAQDLEREKATVLQDTREFCGGKKIRNC